MHAARRIQRYLEAASTLCDPQLIKGLLNIRYFAVTSQFILFSIESEQTRERRQKSQPPKVTYLSLPNHPQIHNTQQSYPHSFTSPSYSDHPSHRTTLQLRNPRLSHPLSFHAPLLIFHSLRLPTDHTHMENTASRAGMTMRDSEAAATEAAELQFILADSEP